MAALKYWVWLASLPGVGSRAKLQLLEHFSSPEEIYYAQPEELLLTGAVNKAQAQLLADKSLARAEDVLSACAKTGQFIVTMDDTTYPSRLRDIFDPPLLLYGKGSMPLFDDEAAIAVVGTRSCTAYGLDVASQLGYELARQGALVLSGMAKGIDGAAMKGALRAGGFTAAVLGGGVDVVYPAENRRIYEDVAATGVVLSEYPPGTEPMASHFPVRNRILSGLSLAAVVVEAPERSGALITASTALEQGREVFAVPGPINAPNSKGCNALIRDGAGLVSEAAGPAQGYGRAGDKARSHPGKAGNTAPAGAGCVPRPGRPDGRPAGAAAGAANGPGAAGRRCGAADRYTHSPCALRADHAGDRRLRPPSGRRQLPAHGGTQGGIVHTWQQRRI